MTPTVLHVNDAAATAARLIGEAARRGQRWRLLPKAAPEQQWRGVTGVARKAAIGAAWVARLRLLAGRHDIVHVHSATTLAHSRLGTRRYVLHCHGTDVRVAQYDPVRGPGVRAGLVEAEAVFYSTPNLAEHVLPHRADAVYLPVPVDVAEIPRWAPADGRPRVVFASRWGPEKGGQAQIDLASDLVSALGGEAEVLGLDWGADAAKAAAAGVSLVPRTSYAGYLDLLRTASVVVGQGVGLLGSSELEALAIGVPVVVAAPLPLYAIAPPVLGHSREGAVEAVRTLISDPRAHDPEATRLWVEREHGVAAAYDTVAKVYADVLAARR